jgi:hypothetical protein
MLCCVPLVRTEISEEHIAYIIMVITTADFPSSPILVTMMEAIYYSETPVDTRATRCHITEYDILHHLRRDNLKSYIALTGCACIAET